MDKALDEMRGKWLTLLGLKKIGFVIVAVWFVYGLIAWSLYGDLEGKGQFGDMYGALNALFSGLAFAGVIITILLQSKELGLQREELKAQREEMKRFADAQEKSEEALSKQAHSMEVVAKLTIISAKIHAESAIGSKVGATLNGRQENIIDLYAEAEKLIQPETDDN